MLKVTIDNEEVLCNKDFTINEEMLNTSSTILNNVYPVEWEEDKDYVSRFYYPKDYSKCKIFDEIYHPETKEEVEGTSFSIEVDKTKQEELLSIKGQTSQSGTPTPESPIPVNVVSGRQVVRVCGKNLFSSGMELGTIDNTTGVNANNSNCIRSINYISVQPNTTYTLSNTMNYHILIHEYGENQNYLQYTGNYGNPKTFTTTSNTYYIRVRSAAGQVENDLNAKYQLELGGTPTTYEEYQGTDYEINLGKNLLDIPDKTATSNGITLTTSDKTISLSGTATATSFLNAYNSNSALYLEPGTYTLSANNPVSAGGSAGQNVIRLMKSNGSDVITGSACHMHNINGIVTFTITEPTTCYLQVRTQSGTTLNNFVIKPQLEKGSSASSFSPYKTPIYLGEMRNTNNVVIAKDYIFRNTTENPLYDSNLEEGQWYIHKEIGRVVLNGSENWSYISVAQGILFRNNTIITNAKNDRTYAPFCNYYRGIPLNNQSNRQSGDMYIYATNNVVDLVDNSQTSASNLKTWLSTHNVEVYYVLNTPATTLIEDEELISQLESIQLISGLNNVSVSSPYLPEIIKFLYNYAPAYTEEDLYFCGVVENTGSISLNPRYPHYCNLQILDFKHFLSIGETLDFVIYEKTIEEAIDQVISVIAPYGFVKGNINILHGDDVIGAYSTKDKTAYDVFNYIADITQSRWTTRMIDENTITIDFYDPTLMPSGTAIEYNQNWFCDNKILDMSFNYSSRDYRNKQVMLSGEVYANISTTEIITADGYQTQFNTTDKIGYVQSILINGNPATIITKEEYDLGYEGDFIYQPGNPYFESDDLISTGAIITIVYYAVIEGREVVLNQNEISRINTMTGRKGVIARYENRNDATTTYELNQIGQSYLKYKGNPEITLKVQSLNNIWNIGERVVFSAPLTELSTEYMVKKKTINYISTQDNIFYTFELTSSFNSETDINYFDNQRAKTMGNIGIGEYISRNIDIENEANVIFYELEVNEVQIEGDSTLQSTLQSPLGVE